MIGYLIHTIVKYYGLVVKTHVDMRCTEVCNHRLKYYANIACGNSSTICMWSKLKSEKVISLK